MENTVNERIAMLKNHFDLGTMEFSVKAEIASGTLWNIEKGSNVSSSTIKKISKAFNVNIEWLKSGKGEMLLPSEKTVPNNSESLVWKEEAYQALKDEVKYLREMLKMAVSGAKSFPNDIAHAGLFQMEKLGNIVRA